MITLRAGGNLARSCSPLDRELEVALSALTRLRDRGTRIADELTAKRLLSAIGIDVPVGRVVYDSREALTAAEETGGPVGIKLVAHDLAHKSELGAVLGPFTSSSEIQESADRLLRQHVRADSGVLVEAWHEGGVECIAGLALNSSFGPLLTFGLGGLWIESLRDVQHRLAPISPEEVAEMINSLQAVSVLRGTRGQAGVDTDGLATTLVRLCEAAVNPDIRMLVNEIEINPLLARADGKPIALDCKIFMRTA
jgi:succinyl-CoA synthetase beta subunit